MEPAIEAESASRAAVDRRGQHQSEEPMKKERGVASHQSVVDHLKRRDGRAQPACCPQEEGL